MTMWLRPNRSLSRRGLRRLCAALAAVTVAIATLGARAGNVYAPLFALVESAAVAYALSLAWHAGDRSERITIDARSLQVECLPGHRRATFQSYWVRVRMRQAGNRQRLVLTSHGGEVEVGAFLGEEERADAMQRLRRLLAQYTAPQRK
ncbi:putative membrane protein [Oleiagrimonas soli]|nr:putative membrane protein [Oleiagrimonas soli]